MSKLVNTICLVLILLSVWGADLYNVLILTDYRTCAKTGECEMSNLKDFLWFKLLGEGFQELCWVLIITCSSLLFIGSFNIKNKNKGGE